MTDEAQPEQEEPEPEPEQVIEQALEQAQQYHAVIDSAKEWSRESVAELRVLSALETDEDTAEEIEQVSSIVKTVTERIEQGDNQRSRQVRR
jgi:hypothetical protein